MRLWRTMVVVTAIVVSGCSISQRGPSPRATTDRTKAAPTTAAPPSERSRARLAPLLIDDQPHTAGYQRDEWPTWKDVDGDGCDARQQALAAASTTPAERRGCKVVSGHWVSAYDGKEATDPAEMEIDHVVPLANAHQSGGWQWETDQRARFANDQADLWVASSAANRSKGAKTPDQWRPKNEAVWCEYASRWVDIKLRWQLSATSSERDALGTMLDRCPA